jgi:hypothetical protein
VPPCSPSSRCPPTTHGPSENHPTYNIFFPYELLI